MRANLVAAASILCFALRAIGASAQPIAAIEVSDFIGLPIIGDKDSRVGNVSDVLISNDGRISAFIANVSGRESEGQRVRIPWSDVAVQQDPLQVELAEGAGDFKPYPGPPAGTLGDINGALATFLIGAPAKTRLGERVGDVIGLSATSDGRVIGATISRGDRQVPLPWDFLEARAERPAVAVTQGVEPVVVVHRRD